jgi:hypothetical protein
MAADELMHVNYHIDRMTPERYGAGFTIHRDKDSDSFLPPVELEQAFPDRETARRALERAMVAHMARRYNLGKDEYTVRERKGTP